MADSCSQEPPALELSLDDLKYTRTSLTHSDLGVAAVAIRSESVTNCPHLFRWLAPHPLVSPHCLSQPRLAPAPASPGPQLAEQPSSRTPATSPMATTALTNRSLLLRTSQPLSPEQALQPWLAPFQSGSPPPRELGPPSPTTGTRRGRAGELMAKGSTLSC